MATQRATMIFKASTTGTLRTGGWSESWYKQGDANTILQALLDLCATRANCLASTGLIVGQRVTTLGGKSISANRNFPGRARLTVDVPQMSLTCNVTNLGNTQKKTFIMRGIPDDAVTGGDFTGGGGMNVAVNGYFQQLQAGGWQWQARDTSFAAVGIQSIGVDGSFVLNGDYVFAVNDFFTLLRVKDVNGHSVVGNFMVKTRTDARTGVFAAWPGRAVNMSGKVRKLAYIYPAVGLGSGVVVRAMVRKVGRPSDLYRGRATVRR